MAGAPCTLREKAKQPVRRLRQSLFACADHPRLKPSDNGGKGAIGCRVKANGFIVMHWLSVHLFSATHFLCPRVTVTAGGPCLQVHRPMSGGCIIDLQNKQRQII
jgi:hypothetical protein